MNRRKTDKGGGWYESIPVDDNRPTCPRCGPRTTMIGQDGECLRCQMEPRQEARTQQVDPSPAA
jgi:hypothetical protein